MTESLESVHTSTMPAFPVVLARDIKGFSEKIIAMLDQQQRYFKTKSKDDLIKSKKLESEVRMIARAYLEWPE